MGASREDRLYGGCGRFWTIDRKQNSHPCPRRLSGINGISRIAAYPHSLSSLPRRDSDALREVRWHFLSVADLKKSRHPFWSQWQSGVKDQMDLWCSFGASSASLVSLWVELPE